MDPLSEFERVWDVATRGVGTPTVKGRLVEVTGTLLKATGLDLQIGDLCELTQTEGFVAQVAEVVGFSGGCSLLAPFEEIHGISRSTRVVPLGHVLSAPVGQAMIGRTIDGLGRQIDGAGEISLNESRPVYSRPPPPLSRTLITEPIETGVRAIDGLASLGDGQRIGIFAPAGVGKSTLLGMLARNSHCDVNVIVLIGERGREVREFIDIVLGPEGMKKSVVVCATSDRSALERSKAAQVGMTIAESFRDAGMKVLLMMDSVTRFARALRELGLAAGEPPTRRGFPPSTFAALPRLLERAGTAARGSITALFTVLVEDDPTSDPIAEELRGLLDGHWILSRDLAAKGHFPAIDIVESLSRVMPQITPQSQQMDAIKLRKLISSYRDVETLIQIGEYQSGSDPLADEAISKLGLIEEFLQQRVDEKTAWRQTVNTMRHIAS